MRLARTMGCFVLVATTGTGARALRAQGSPARGCGRCPDAAGTLVLRTDTAPGLLREGANAASYPLDAPVSARRTALTVAIVGGDFRRPQHPARSRLARLDTEGVARLGSWIAAGRFRYARVADDGVHWTNAADPYGATPYVWADSIGGDWRRDDAGLGLALASPAWRSHIRAGMSVEYDIGLGARRNEPRPLYRSRAITLAPALAWHVGASHRIGLTARFGWRREDDEVGGQYGNVSASNGYPVVFHLRGLGTFDRTQLIEAARTTTGYATDAGAHYAGDLGAWRMAVAGDVGHSRDGVRDGVAVPVFGGRSDATAYTTRFGARRPGARRSIDFRLEAGFERSRGTDPTFRAVNVVDENSHASLAASAWRGADRLETPLVAGGELSLVRLARRDVVTETRWSATLPELAAGVEGRRAVGGFRVITAMRVRYVAATERQYEALRASVLTDALVRRDFLAYAAPRRGLDLGLGLEWGRGGRSRVLVEGASTRAAGSFDDGRSLGGRSTFRLTYEIR
jgi:hypothetical protein